METIVLLIVAGLLLLSFIALYKTAHVRSEHKYLWLLVLLFFPFFGSVAFFFYLADKQKRNKGNVGFSRH